MSIKQVERLANTLSKEAFKKYFADHSIIEVDEIASKVGVKVSGRTHITNDGHNNGITNKGCRETDNLDYVFEKLSENVE